LKSSSELQVTGIKQITFDYANNYFKKVSSQTPEDFENKMFE
jgi:hypothetical protein